MPLFLTYGQGGLVRQTPSGVQGARRKGTVSIHFSPVPRVQRTGQARKWCLETPLSVGFSHTPRCSVLCREGRCPQGAYTLLGSVERDRVNVLKFYDPGVSEVEAERQGDCSTWRREQGAMKMLES